MFGRILIQKMLVSLFLRITRRIRNFSPLNIIIIIRAVLKSDINKSVRVV